MEINRYYRKDNPNYRVSQIFIGMNHRAWNRDGKHPTYENIGICEEWDVKKRPFNEALADFVLWAWTHGYNDTLSIDRIDNSRGYEPLNCRWATQKEQQRNRSMNHSVIIDGVEYGTIAEAVETLHREADYKTIETRIYLYGWTADRAFNTPIAERGHSHEKQITIDGIEYKSVSECCRALNLNYKVIHKYRDRHHITWEQAVYHYLKEI